MTTIYTRSPYKIGATGTVGQEVKIELYIYNAPSSVPTTPTRVETKIIPSTSLTTVYFNICPYIREYIDFILFTEVTTPSTILSTEYAKVYVKVYVNNVLQSSANYNCLDGYGYNTDGWNHSNTLPAALLTEGSYLVSEDSSGALYFDTTENGTAYDVSYYEPISGSLISDFTITNGINKIPYLESTAFASGGNRLDITVTSTGVLVASYLFETYCSGRYEPYNCDFINRFGVWQRLTLFGAKRTSIKGTGTEYNFMNREADFNPAIGNTQTLNKNGRKSIRVNTGLVDEFYEDVITQLFLSEKIMVNNESVTLTTSQADLLKHENVKQINYPLEFKYSNTLINTGI